jgi:Ca-activated chloride channel homolog
MNAALMRVWKALVPTPRRAVSWTAAWPLLVGCVVFASLCLGLELSRTLVFARPWALGLIVLSVWVWWLSVAGYAGLPKGRSQVAFLVRFTLLALVVMLLAEPRAVRERDQLSVMYLVDLSDSIRSNSVDDALRYVVESAQTKPNRDEIGLMVFGKTPGVEQPPRMSYGVEALNSQVEKGSTNIEQALSLAGAMLPEDNPGRIVLVSDGVQTEGNLSRVLDDLKNRDIAIDVLPIDYSYEREVWLERIDLPQQVKLGETYEAAMVLSSIQAGSATLSLRENGKLIAEQPIEFQAGKNRYAVPITLRSAGYYEYEASISVDRSQDSLTQNNQVQGYIFVQGEGQVLLVTNPAGDPRDWQTLAQALQEAERAVRVVSAYDLPDTLPALLPYDAIIFCNVPYDAFGFGQLSALKDAVYNAGIGFLMVGGGNSFGPGGYHRTVVEEILPVTMDISNKKILPKGALAIILHTCEFPEGNTWAKRITKQAIKVLSGQDDVGVLAYTGTGEDWIFELTPASDYAKMAPLIDGASVGDMPSFQSTMQMGLDGLKANTAATKHMIIISDGDPSPPTPQLMQDFVDAKISISTVAVFPHGGMEQTALQSIAEFTSGRYYFVNNNPEVLPSIFIKESKTLKKSMVQEKTVAPQAGFPSPILKGIDSVPNLEGYVLTNAKPHPAMTILQCPPEAEDPTQQDPLLVVWQHGLGKTAAFTSDLSTNWGKNWVNWDHYRAFVKQLMTDISRVQSTSSLQLSTFAQGGEALIVVEDFHPEESLLDVQGRISGPGGKSESIRLKQVSPRRYQATVPLWGHGRYHVQARGGSGDRQDQAFGGLIVSYSPEYLRFRSQRQSLTDIADRTGGRILSGQVPTDQVFQFNRAPRRSSRPIFDWFLIAVACLIPVDVAIRRIQIDVKSILRALSFRKSPQTVMATMGTLLERKQQVQATLKQRGEGEAVARPIPWSPPRTSQPMSPSGSGSTAAASTAASASSTATAGNSGAAAEGPVSTTERLLQLKRKRESDAPPP